MTVSVGVVATCDSMRTELRAYGLFPNSPERLSVRKDDLLYYLLVYRFSGK